jgi:hypothetical protein
MGVRYLSSYTLALGPPVVSDLAAIPRFRDVDDGTTANAVVIDASGGLARYLKPDDSERNAYDYQELFERVAVDVAAFRALGYEPVPFLDAAVPADKLSTWKTRRRAEFVRLGKIARAVEWASLGQGGGGGGGSGGGGGAGASSAATATNEGGNGGNGVAPTSSTTPPPPPPPFPKNCWVPPEAATQHLADAFAAAGCRVFFGAHDVDLEVAAAARQMNAFAVLTCDSDLYVTCACRVWSFERFDVDHWLWRREGDKDDEEGQGAAAGAAGTPPPSPPVWLPPEGSPGVRGETRRRARVGRPRWLLGRGSRPLTQQEEEAEFDAAMAASGGGASPRPPLSPLPLFPRIPVREVRTDLLRAELGLPLEAMPLLAACLGNDGIAHITRKQLEAVFAEHPGLPALPASAKVAAALLADAALAGGGSGAAATDPRAPLPPGSLLAPDGPGGGEPWRVVEILGKELARQLREGVLDLRVLTRPGGGGGGGDGEGGGESSSNYNDNALATAAAAAARAAASNPRRPATARYVAHRATLYASTVRRAYDPATLEERAAESAAAGLAAAAAAAATASPSAPLGPLSFSRGGLGTHQPAPNVMRCLLHPAGGGRLVRGVRMDDAREPPASALALRTLRLRAYGGCGLARVRELMYAPVAVRPPPAPPRASVSAAVAAAAEGDDATVAATAPAAAADAPPPLPTPTVDGPLGAPGRTGGFFWQEEFVDVDVQAELAALGLTPLLPSSPEITAAQKSGAALVAFASAELLRLELITPYEAELLKRQASPKTRGRVRRQAGARRPRQLLGNCPRGRWSGGDRGVVCCMRSVRVCALLTAVHTWVAFLLDNHVPTIESVLDVRVFNELWRRNVARLEREAQPKAAAQRERWVWEGAPPPSQAAAAVAAAVAAQAVAAAASASPDGGEPVVAGSAAAPPPEAAPLWYWLPPAAADEGGGGGNGAAGGGAPAVAATA